MYEGARLSLPIYQFDFNIVQKDIVTHTVIY